MKKNIQINLFGTLYNIDDDAYQLLENYLESMKSYFSQQDGGEEIADDIEHRVAELLWQHKQYGMEAVNIETVKEIIAQIGNPQEIDDATETDGETVYDEVEEAQGTGDGSSAAEEKEGKASFMDDVKKNVTKRRFYRNPSDKMIGGVCSGLAQYVGKGDVTLWRLAFVVLPFLLDTILAYFGAITRFMHISSSGLWFFPSGFWMLPAAYVILCIIVPEARTAEDRLRMKGEEVTPENINAQVISDTTNNVAAQPKQPTSSGGGCLKALFVMILLFFALPFIFITIMILIVIIFSVFAMIGVSGWSIPFINAAQTDLGISNTFFSDYGWLVTTGSIAGLIVIVIPLYMLIKRIMGGQFGKHSVTVLFIIWLLMLAWSIFSLIMCGSSFQKYISHTDFSPDIHLTDSTMTQPSWQQMEELEDTAAIDLMSE